MRALALTCALALAGCHTSDPCFGHDGSCIGLTVEGGGAITQVDQLSIDLSSIGLGTMPTPPTPMLASLPVTTAVYLPASTSGDVTLAVVGMQDGTVVGSGTWARSIAPGDHVSADVVLSAPSDFDAGGVDTASPIDAAGRTRRYVFLVGPTVGALGNINAGCVTAATDNSLPGTGYRALYGIANGSDQTLKSVSPNRDVVLPDGTLVSSDQAFFTASHVGPINQLADKSAPKGSCVWTNLTAQGAARASDCRGWSSGLIIDSGNAGNDQAIQQNWADDSTQTCDKSCYVYCIEDD